MNSETILVAYLKKFNKMTNEWANTSTEYARRNDKEDFRHVMIKMDSFLRSYVGPLKFEAYQSAIMRHLIRNGYIISRNGKVDVTESRYKEYKNAKI